MDALSPISPATATARTPGQPEAEPKQATAISADFQTFLKMLTVQMKNQDPLEPVKSEDFAVQLATFSGVEQQVRTNDLLKSMQAQQSLSGLSQLAGWIGMEARTEAPVRFEGQPVTLYPDLPSGTDQATLVVRNAQGTEVGRAALPIADGPVQWSGTDQSGAPLPAGNYDLQVESREKGKLLAVATPPHYARITEARLDAGEPVLVFASGATKPASDVTAVRLPQ